MKSASVSWADGQLEKEHEYWLQKLSGELVVTGIPIDFKRPPVFKRPREARDLVVNGLTQGTLNKVCAGNELLVFAACVTAIKVCLHKYTGMEDVLIGTAIHGRYRELTPFNKILALRDHLSGGETIRQLLGQVLQTLTEAYAHQKYSFSRLLQQLNIEVLPNRAPLFNVVALLEDINRPENVAWLANDVTLRFAFRDGMLSGVIEYYPELFKPETIAVFVRHFETALRFMMAYPDLKLSQLKLLSEEQIHEFLFEFNQTNSVCPRDKTIAELFEGQVEKTPDAVAIIFEERSLTYLELHQRANQLAHYLRNLEVGPGTLVGLYLEHSLETVVGVLGVLKAGAAYVPLDTQHPLARTAFMLSNSGISIVLTQGALADRISDQASTVICLDIDWQPFISQQSSASPSPESSPGDLAYVIYTSGSTGSPKGVTVSHAALVNYVWWAKETYLRDDCLDFPLYSSLAFDLTVTSLFVPLVAGRRLLIYRQKENDLALSAVLEDNQAGILKLTPSHLSLLKVQDNRNSNVKRLIVGGEAFESDLARQIWNSFGGQVEIYNEYGPTEATVGCMVHLFNPQEDTRTDVPIGKPAANTQIYLLDEDLNPVPENVRGEIYISGAGLASGYLNGAGQTAERFIDNPFLADQKMYKTGDVARRLPEGILEYVGRNDEQVKFHGYRLDLNEIRGALNQHPEVNDSIVVLVKDRNGNDVLVAYYVSRHELDSRALRAALARSIIEATIPNVFAYLQELPLTLNGKVDRRKLPPLEAIRDQARPAFVFPRTPTERFIANTWQQLLALDQVGIHDNFFELGGHSLLAYQVIARLGEAFQLEIPMRSIFDSATVAELALAVTQMELAREDIQEVAQMIEEIKLMSPEEVENILTADNRLRTEERSA